MSTKLKAIAVCSAVFLSVSFALYAHGTQESSSTAPTTLKVAMIYDSVSQGSKPGYDWFSALNKAYEQKYPNVKTSLEYIEWDKIDVKLMADYRAGITSHDVAMTTPQLLPEEGVVGNLADMTPFVNKLSQSELAEFEWAPPWKQAYQNGKMIGVPLGIDTRLLVYNKAMFTAAGLDPNNPPTSLAELVQYAQKLTNSAHYGLGMYMGPQRATIELTFAPLIWNFGGRLWDPATKKADFASPAGVQAAQFLRDLVAKYQVTPKADVAGGVNDAILNPFLNNQIAMAWGWGNYQIEPLEAKGFTKGLFPPTPSGHEVNVGIVPLPTSVHAAFDNSWDVSIYSLSQHKQDAWNYIMMMLGGDRLLSFPDAGLPLRKSLWSSASFQTPFYKIWQTAAAEGRPMPATAHYGNLADTVAAALQQIVTGNADIATTLKQAQDQYNAQYAGQ